MSQSCFSPRVRRKYKTGVKRKDTSVLTFLNINNAEEAFSLSQLLFLLKSQLLINNDILDTVVLINKVAGMIYDSPVFSKYFAQYSITLEIIQEILQDAQIISLEKGLSLFQSTEDINRSFILIDGVISIRLPLVPHYPDDLLKKAALIRKFYHQDAIQDGVQKEIDCKLLAIYQLRRTAMRANSKMIQGIVRFNVNQGEGINKTLPSTAKAKRQKTLGLREKLPSSEEVELFEVTNSFIGEIDLSYQPKRFYSAYANTPCYLLSIDRVYTEYIMKLILKAESDQKMFFMDHSQSLKHLSKQSLNSFFEKIEKRLYKAKDAICSKGNEADSIFFIHQGSCSSSIDNHVIYDRGDFFGLEALRQYIDIQQSKEEALAGSNGDKTNVNVTKTYGVYSSTIVANIINTTVLKIKLNSIPLKLFKSFSEQLLKCHLEQSEIRDNLHQLKKSRSSVFKMKYNHLNSHQSSDPSQHILQEGYSINQQIKHYQLNPKQRDAKNAKQQNFKLITQLKPFRNTSHIEDFQKIKTLNSWETLPSNSKPKVLGFITRNKKKEKTLLYRRLNRIQSVRRKEKPTLSSSSKPNKAKYSLSNGTRLHLAENCSCSSFSIRLLSPNSNQQSKREEGFSDIQLSLLTGTAKPRPKHLTLTERIHSSVKNWKKTISDNQREFETSTYKAPLFSFITSV